MKIAPTEQGFYTVQVSSFNGGAAAVNFELRYGRYASAGPQLHGGYSAAGQREPLIR